MISLIPHLLALDPDCPVVAAQFDPGAEAHALSRESGIALPQRLQTAVVKRQLEFLAGRYCARQALAALNGPAEQPISIGENRAPVWPAGFLGSITHTRGFAAAAVAREEKILAVGIDTESLIAPDTTRNVWEQIITPEEGLEASPLPDPRLAEERFYLTLIFSAKESLFKCLYPLVNQYFGFHAARIRLSRHSPGVFHYHLTETLTAEFAAGYSGEGYYAIDDDYIHTGILLPNI